MSRKCKEKIPVAVKATIWVGYYGEEFKGGCACCGASINVFNFQCGHVEAESCGGKVTLGNLRPICAKCNTSMGRTNMIVFMEKYGFNKTELWVKYEKKYCAKRIITPITPTKSKSPEIVKKQNTVLHKITPEIVKKTNVWKNSQEWKSNIKLLSNLTVKKMRQLCIHYGLVQKGIKKKVISRLCSMKDINNVITAYKNKLYIGQCGDDNTHIFYTNDSTSGCEMCECKNVNVRDNLFYEVDERMYLFLESLLAVQLKQICMCLGIHSVGTKKILKDRILEHGMNMNMDEINKFVGKNYKYFIYCGGIEIESGGRILQHVVYTNTLDETQSHYCNMCKCRCSMWQYDNRFCDERIIDFLDELSKANLIKMCVALKLRRSGTKEKLKDIICEVDYERLKELIVESEQDDNDLAF